MAPASQAEEGRRSPLTREMIARAAMGLVDREGLSSLTMRRLGTALQVEAMSLYSHFTTKEEMLNEVADLLFQEVTLPAEEAEWERFSWELFLGLRRVLLSHPNAVPLLVGRWPRSQAALAPIEASLRSLRLGGFDEATALDGHCALMSFTVGYLLHELGRPSEPSVNPDSWATGLYGLTNLSSQETPHLWELAPFALQREDDEQFAAGLAVVLAGLRTSLGGQRPKSDGRPGP